MGLSRRSLVFSPWSLIGQARLYEQHLRETEQWVAYGFYLEFVLPTLGRIAGQRGALQLPFDLWAPTPGLVKSAIAVAAARGDGATAYWAWKDFLEFVGYVAAGVDMSPDSL